MQFMEALLKLVFIGALVGWALAQIHNSVSYVPLMEQRTVWYVVAE